MRVMELHSPVIVIGRSGGRTATAAAAYRSATRIECERTGQIHDYTRKQGVEGIAMLLPDDAPDWAHDRAQLWNAAERREKRKDAQTARELSVAFPAEFTAEQRREAGLRIGRLLTERYGSVVDLAWHEPNRNGDERNHHIHMLFTTRRFENGEWAGKKDRLLDDRRAGPEEIKSLRAAIAGNLNDISARDQLGVYVEHLSFEERGLEREATQHMGPHATNLERRGVKTDIGDKNRRIRVNNKRRDALRQESEVIDLAVEREKRLQQSPALVDEKQERRSIAYGDFYENVLQRRSGVLSKLDQQYGGRERELAHKLPQLYSITTATGVVKLWRDLTGQTQKAQRAIAEAQATLAEIQKQRAAAMEQFEQQRQAQLVALNAKLREEEQAGASPALDLQQQTAKRQQDVQRRKPSAQPEPPGNVPEFAAAAHAWKPGEGLSDDEKNYPIDEASDNDPIAEQIRARVQNKSMGRRRGRGI